MGVHDEGWELCEAFGGLSCGGAYFLVSLLWEDAYKGEQCDETSVNM